MQGEIGAQRLPQPSPDSMLTPRSPLAPPRAARDLPRGGSGSARPWWSCSQLLDHSERGRRALRQPYLLPPGRPRHWSGHQHHLHGGGMSARPICKRLPSSRPPHAHQPDHFDDPTRDRGHAHLSTLQGPSSRVGARPHTLPPRLALALVRCLCAHARPRTALRNKLL